MAQRSKTKIFYYWRKFQVFTYFSTFGEFYLVKKQKPWKKSRMDQFVKSSDNVFWKYGLKMDPEHWQNLWRIGPSMIFFKVFAFLLSKIQQKLKNKWILEIFSNNKKICFWFSCQTLLGFLSAHMKVSIFIYKSQK